MGLGSFGSPFTDLRPVCLPILDTTSCVCHALAASLCRTTWVCQVSVFSPPAWVHWVVHCSWVKLHRHAFLVDFPTWRICTLQDKPFPDWTENLTGLHKKWQTCYSCKSFPRKMAKNTPPQCAVRLNTLLLKKILENLAVLPRIYPRNVSPVETSF